MPPAYAELDRLARILERHFRDVQDMEFTIERGKLYMLQTRRAQRSGQAAVRIACEMVDEGAISEDEAVARIPPNDLNQLLHPDDRPQGPSRPADDRSPRLTRRRIGHRGVRCRPGRAAGPQGRGGDPGATGDQPRGLPRHGRRQGDSHRAGRHDESRGGRGARHRASPASPAPRSSRSTSRTCSSR